MKKRHFTTAIGSDGAFAPTRVEQCERCEGDGEVGPRTFPVACPDCEGGGAVVADG
jgi:DnaJ-class molecular chaperone